MNNDNFIHVTEEAWGDERPRAAFIHIILTANKLFSGDAAFEKAVELRRLVIALGERDFPESVLSLTGATLDVSSGIFTRSSSVTYGVRVHVRDIVRLADAFDAIAESKQARITHLEWDYGHEVINELMTDCATRAMGKAKRLASALGVMLGVVHSVHEEQLGDATLPPEAHSYHQESMAGMSRRSIGDELIGLDLGPTKKVGVRVRLAYAMTT